MSERTVHIRNADWVVRWNPEKARHEYLRGADVVFRDDTVTYVGRNFTGAADETIDGRGLMAMPGLINLHCHPTNQPVTRGVREEIANPALYMTSLYDRTNLWRADQDALYYGAVVAYGELLKSGVTTTVDYAGRIPKGWVAQMAESGLRIVASPSFRDASWSVTGGSRLEYRWEEDRERSGFDGAMALIEEATSHPCGRLTGMIAPGQVDTCSEDTFRRCVEAAEKLGIPMQTHACQTLPEFHEMVRRHNRTPVQWLSDIGALGPRTILAHCIFIDTHSWTHWHTSEDIGLLAESGTAVSHCPVVFSRYGHMLQSFGGYRRAGIKVGIGTDTAPHNLLEEMRQAVIISRVATGRYDDATATDAFNSATIDPAAALGRADIGRLCEGSKADIVLVDVTHPLMQPTRDPLRNLIYTACDRAVRDVYVDGIKRVENGAVLSMDIEGATEKLAEAQFRAEKTVPTQDAEGREGYEISPPVLPFGD